MTVGLLKYLWPESARCHWNHSSYWEICLHYFPMRHSAPCTIRQLISPGLGPTRRIPDRCLTSSACYLFSPWSGGWRLQRDGMEHPLLPISVTPPEQCKASLSTELSVLPLECSFLDAATPHKPSGPRKEEDFLLYPYKTNVAGKTWRKWSPTTSILKSSGCFDSSLLLKVDLTELQCSVELWWVLAHFTGSS